MGIRKSIAIICLSPYNGGMELDSIKTALHLSKVYRVVLIAKKGYFIEKKAKNLDNIILETISFKSNFSFSIIFGVRNLIKKYSISDIVFFGASELKSIYFSLIGLDTKINVRHGTTKSTPKKDFFHRLIYSNINYHISNSKHIEKNVKKIIPFGKNSKSIVIYQAMEFKNITKQKQNKLTLLHVGRIAKGKGQVDAIKACEILVKNNIEFEFLIVGGFEESYKKEFMNFYNNISYKDKIKLVGFSSEVEKYYSISDIFIFPSYGEGLSNAFIEALYYGLVGICYNNTSFPELKELGLEFFMVENRNINLLKEELIKVAKNIDNLKFHNDKVIKKIFSVDNEIKKYNKILN